MDQFYFNEDELKLVEAARNFGLWFLKRTDIKERDINKVKCLLGILEDLPNFSQDSLWGNKDLSFGVETKVENYAKNFFIPKLVRFIWFCFWYLVSRDIFIMWF